MARVGLLDRCHPPGRIHQRTLKRIFAVFLVVMAGYILVRQALRVMPGVFGPAAATSPAHWEPDSPGAPLMA